MVDVSVIIPTFNRLWGLPKAVDSCFSQGCNVEVIVVDDGSTDGTWEWLQTRKDVVSIRQENWGKDWAVVAGVAAARGEYIRFLDSDDWLEPQANGEQWALARETGADIVVAGYHDYYEDDDRQRAASLGRLRRLHRPAVRRGELLALLGLPVPPRVHCRHSAPPGFRVA